MDKISALMDGELDERQSRQLFSRLKQDQELLQCWRTFHLIGDALRGERALSDDFDRRLGSRLLSEPTVLAPRRSTARHITAYALSAAASLSAVAWVGWVAFSGNPLVPQSPIAQAPSTPNTPRPVTSPPPTQMTSIPSDGRMNEYLIAHQEFSPSTAIQGVAPYIRGVSDTQMVTGRQ